MIATSQTRGLKILNGEGWTGAVATDQYPKFHPSNNKSNILLPNARNVQKRFSDVKDLFFSDFQISDSVEKTLKVLDQIPDGVSFALIVAVDEQTIGTVDRANFDISSGRITGAVRDFNGELVTSIEEVE